MIAPCAPPPGEDPRRWVGDPVDVVTGDQFDAALEFRIPWPFPFEWRRFYSARRADRALPLGLGHTHAYDHRLAYAVDGLAYTDPAGHLYRFPAVDVGATAVSVGGGVLRRPADGEYRVKVSGFPECAFEFVDANQPARLVGLLRGRASHALRYGRDGRWVSVEARGHRPLFVASDDLDRVVALFFLAPDGNREHPVWQAAYDAEGHLVRIVSPYGAVQSFAYDAAHRMTERTDRRGYRYFYEFDRQGRCIRSGTEDGVQDVRLRYLPDEGATVLTRADGGTWTHQITDGSVTQVVDPYGGVRSYTYGATGGLEQEVGPEGEIVQIAEVVDDFGGTILRRPLEPTFSMTFVVGDPWFDFNRRLDLPRDPMGWDGHGEGVCRNAIRLPLRDDPALSRLPRRVAAVIRFAERPDEGPTPPPSTVHKQVGVPERPGRLTYDPFGLLASHTDPYENTARWQYDHAGNVIRYTDYAGSVWRYEYASWNHLVREIDPLGGETEYRYNATECTVEVTDPAGGGTRMEYDLKDRMTERRRHGDLRDALGYDLSEGVVRVGERGAERIILEVGSSRRPLRIRVQGRKPRDCHYDGRGRLVGIVEEEGETLEFAYDEVGRRTVDTRDGTGVRRTYEGSKLASVSVGGSYTVLYAQDDEADAVVVTDPKGGTHRVELVNAGIRLRRFANGVVELCQYDWNGRCLRKARFRPDRPQAVWTRAYAYSPVGALLSEEDSERGTTSYDYDAAHRLVRASRPDGTTLRWAHDRAGNLVEAPGRGRASYDGNRLVRAGESVFEHDARHHLARESGPGVERTYVYDSEDRLTECSSNGRVVAFGYDALGRRTSKSSQEGTTEFTWDGERLAAEKAPDGRFRVYLYTDGRGLTPFAFVEYDDENADPASGALHYVFANQVGCPVRVEDEAGRTVWSADVDPYGLARVDTDASVALNLRWPGHYFDPETGLHYNRHRYYSPDLGRYLQVDPRDIEGGLNVYAYTSRPLDQVDVDGLAPCPKKPMVTPDEDDAEFQRARQEADEVAENMRRAIREAEENGEMWPGGTTAAALVVRDRDGNYEVVVTANGNPAGFPPSVRESMGGRRVVGWGPDQTDGPYPGGSNDRPPSVRVDENDPGWNYPRTNGNGDRELTTHNHAEQRGLRAVDCDDNLEGVAHVAPTRPCCEGCSSAIQTPEDRGGWGGSGDNVSDHGRQPGGHGDWW